MGRPGCNVERALNIIGGKWSTLIVRDLLSGDKRFGELEQSLGISSKSLNLKLKNLEKNMVINRKVIKDKPPKVIYSLTEYGKMLKPVIESLEEWGRKEPPKIINLK